MSSLFQRFIEPQNFELAWDQVRSNNGCEGVDGETIGRFKRDAAKHLEQLRRSLIAGTYRPLPLRQLFVPKKVTRSAIPGELPQQRWRELGIPAVRDRLVQQALLQVLHPLMEAEFEPCSFAYRPGRSHLMATRQVGRWRDRGYEWVLDADIVRYFDNIQHSRLLAEVKERVNQPWLLALIEGWIGAGVLTREGIVLPLKGVPQGAVISPILANIYLDDFDEQMGQAGWKLVRYADDFVLLSRSQRRLIEGKAEVERILASMGLELHPDKTRITTFDKGFRFLGHAFAGDVVVKTQPQSSSRESCSPHPPAPSPGFDSAQPTGEGEQFQSPSPRAGEGLAPAAFKKRVRANPDRLVHIDPGSEQPTLMHQALVEALKQQQQPIPPPLYVALGYRVREERQVSIKSNETEWRNGMSSLYLVQQGTRLSKEQSRFVLVPPKEEELEIPIREVDRVLVFGNIQLTSAVIGTCLELQIPVVFLSQMGEYKGHLWSAESADLAVEASQFRRHGDEEWRRAVARQIVKGKLWNSKVLLLRQNRKRQIQQVAQTITRLDDDRLSVDQLGNTPTLDAIRGYEGAGAARYFAAMNQLIVNPGFEFKKRQFHPPADPFNSLLSFGYTLLYNNVFSLLLVEGLNPYLGNLHGAERQKAYLAFDLMEEFRSPVVDTVVMKVVNRKIISPTDFTFPTQEGGVYLTDPARRIFLKHFESRMSELTSHPDVKQQVSYRRAIHLQVQRYRKVLLGERDYEPFLR